MDCIRSNSLKMKLWAAFWIINSTVNRDSIRLNKTSPKKVIIYQTARLRMLLMKHLTHQPSDSTAWMSLFWFLLRNKAPFHCRNFPQRAISRNLTNFLPLGRYLDWPQKKLLGGACGLLGTDWLNVEQDVLQSQQMKSRHRLSSSNGLNSCHVSLLLVFFVVNFLRHSRNCRTNPCRLKPMTSPRGPPPQWRHGHQEGRVRGMGPVMFLPPYLRRTLAVEMWFYINKVLGKRQWFQEICHGAWDLILHSSLFTSAQMLSLGFMVQCGHSAVHLNL